MSVKFEETLLKEYCNAFNIDYKRALQNKDRYLDKALKLCHLKRSSK